MAVWLIAQDEDPGRVLAQHGWTKARHLAMEFRTEFEAQSHISSRRVAGHTVQLTDKERESWTKGAYQTDYNPFGTGA